MSERQVSEVRTSQREPNREQRIFTFKATYMIWLLVVMLEGLIALRIGLKLIGANADNSFAALIYGFTSLFLFPFVGLTGTPAVGGMVLEISSMIAMVVYGLAGWAFERLVWVIFYRPREAAVAVTQRTSSEQRTE
jgi:YggT family protein